MDQRWARLFSVGEHQVAVYIVGDGVDLGLMITAMVDDSMVGESEIFPGESFDQIRQRLDAVTQLEIEAWLAPAIAAPNYN